MTCRLACRGCDVRSRPSAACLRFPPDAGSPAYLRAGYVAALENARRTYGSLHR